jgi:Site-specific DNA methylase
VKVTPRNKGHPILNFFRPKPPPISWMGGKRSILPIILARFPLHFTRYIEVFGGSGVVLFGKEPSPFEIWNDMNSDLYNFYYCVKYKHLQLLWVLKFLPFTSRTEFKLLRKFLRGEPFPNLETHEEIMLAHEHFSAAEAAELETLIRGRCELGDVNRAAAFWKLNHLSYGSGMTSFNTQPLDLRRFYSQIYAAHDRLAGVLLENKDFGLLIKQQDKPGTLFYLDPPYYDAEGCYEVVFPREDHMRLYHVLTDKEFKSKWLLSYNDCEFIRELYKDYPQYRFERPNSLVHRYINNENDDEKPNAKYGEIIIANFDMDERGRQHEQLTFGF